MSAIGTIRRASKRERQKSGFGVRSVPTNIPDAASAFAEKPFFFSASANAREPSGGRNPTRNSPAVSASKPRSRVQ